MSSGTPYSSTQVNLIGQPKTNQELREFALALLHADSEDEIIGILKLADYWDNSAYWRLYGDKEGNWSQAGNQQSFPEASLVEKIINSVDSRLMLECLLRDLDPISDKAPTSIRDAVAMFFENRRAEGDEAGVISNWSQPDRLAESRKITIAATGGKPTKGKKSKKMCITIADLGEGQSAKRMPKTILSLNAKNKQRIRFVQGKFNMGGSGALRFCGESGIQVVVSRRHRELAKNERDRDETVDMWTVTVVRREEPSIESGSVVHSEFTYLAPIGSFENPRKGGLLRFDSPTLPIMPEHDEPYSREVEHGTAIKLIEYETKAGQSNILLSDGLLYALERLMPQIALPIKLHECRDYSGKQETSFETPLAGLVVRLESGKGDNLEIGFPKTATIFAGGTKMIAKIYAFKEDKARTYLADEGVIFQINGQSHGYLPKSIFSRPRKVGLQRLRDSLLVLIDCSELSTRSRENLFMTSRDRLSNHAIRFEIEDELMSWLKNEPSLKQLQQERREKDVHEKLREEKPLEEVLGKVMRASPTLEKLFLAGQRLSRPFAGGDSGGGGESAGDGGGSKRSRKNGEYIGNRHPTFFEVVGVNKGDVLQRRCEIGRRCRIKFKTDVENSYFDRATDKGTYELEIIDEDRLGVPNANFSLDNGDAFLSLTLPADAKEGDKFTIEAIVDDPTLIEPFSNFIHLTVVGKTERKGGKGRSKRKPGKGKGKLGDGKGITLPNVIPVREGDENWKRYNFDSFTACEVISETANDNNEVEHTFYMNMSNTYLLTEMKYGKMDPRVLEAKFKYGNVLLGIAMLHDDENNKEKEKMQNGDIVDVQSRIRTVTGAVSPILLPMIDQLSGLNEDELESIGIVDDD